MGGKENGRLQKHLMQQGSFFPSSFFCYTHLHFKNFPRCTVTPPLVSLSFHVGVAKGNWRSMGF
jgi:hypothetical protein